MQRISASITQYKINYFILLVVCSVKPQVTALNDVTWTLHRLLHNFLVSHHEYHFHNFNKKLKIEVIWVLALLLATTAEVDVWRETKRCHVHSDISHSLYFQLWWSVSNFLVGWVFCHSRTSPIPSLPIHGPLQRPVPKTSMPWKQAFPSVLHQLPRDVRGSLHVREHQIQILCTEYCCSQSPSQRQHWGLCDLRGYPQALKGSPKSTLRFSGWFQAGSPGSLPCTWDQACL